MNTSNDLTSDEVEFLALWLMHYGTEWVDRWDKPWYAAHPLGFADRTAIWKCFDHTDRHNMFRLNERGLAAIEQGVRS